ncbi:MAG: NADH-quinone oxidoreductase subunit C, partial [Ramlibacter sp.]
MTVAGLNLPLQRLPAPLPLWHGRVDAERWHAAARNVAHAGGRLLSLGGSDSTQHGDTMLVVSAAYAMADGVVWLDLALGDGRARYPDLAGIFPYAARMQRAAADLLGVEAQGAEDTRPWLNHGLWPDGQFPLRRDNGSSTVRPRPALDYPFVRVEGDGVHEIAVGPVHAGIIEPGHFRFSVVGEKVLRLEQRLGYTHKGIEQRFTELAPLQGHRLAGRVSGDSTVAFAWAYCMALESAVGC